MKLEITESQAKNLIDLIDIWFYREIREDENLDNLRLKQSPAKTKCCLG